MFLKSLTATLVVVAALCGPKTAMSGPKTWEQGREALYARMDAMSPFERRMVVLAALDDVSKNDNNLEQDTPKERSDVLKIKSVEFALFAEASKKANWNELAKVCDDASHLFSKMVRGEIDRKISLAQADDWAKRFEAVRQANKREHQREFRTSTPSKEFDGVRHELAAYVGATARAVVWGPEMKGGEHSPTTVSAATRNAIAEDVARQKQGHRLAQLACGSTKLGAPRSVDGGRWWAQCADTA